MKKLTMCGAAAVAIITGALLTAGAEGAPRREAPVKDQGGGVAPYAGRRNVDVQVKGGTLRGVIEWDYRFTGESSLKVWGAVTSTGRGCVQARLHYEEVLLGQGRSHGTNKGGFPDRFEEPVVGGQRRDLIVNSVCGSGKSHEFHRAWRLQPVSGRTKLWMDVWLGLKTEQAWSGWK
ncbi:hypothetical protein [Actinomadura rudentiformis]|uniref:PLAT domain-containing protein n=1 Tax=Actinomadura rudentiformis TaxID=359158 RepID=A0A6H9Z1Z8_9ACTN|nr:hypothetical protein [Actinomadura rudentiformis]KAB2348286.1 hypothetical protein F8566_15830 [Actinomadura rudentiformis]